VERGTAMMEGLDERDEGIDSAGGNG